jgi:alanine racemase
MQMGREYVRLQDHRATSMIQGENTYSNWLEIDLGAIENNIRWFLRNTGVEVMAVVKANAYGHGAVPVAQAALRAGATWCGVARIDEALELRRAGLDCPILLLGFTPAGRVQEAIAERISLTVWSAEQIMLALTVAQRVGQPARLHLKVDTGMSRLGAQPEEAQALAIQLSNLPGITFEGLFTHFARADEADRSTTERQETTFRQVLSVLDAKGLRPPLVHAANSAAGLTRPSAYFSLVRAGIAIYGLHPSKECPLPEEFRPALSWKAALSQVKVLPPGRGLSYGHEYTTRTVERIGTLPAGYADGLRRVKGNQVLVAGRRVPVVGRVCMDQALLQLDGVPHARPGDEVVLIGTQEAERISAEEVARRWSTINYEVVCGIGPRVPRLYF